MGGSGKGSGKFVNSVALVAEMFCNTRLVLYWQ